MDEEIPSDDWTAWSPNDVGNWLSNVLKLPQYSDCFVTNEIDGPTLVQLSEDMLEANLSIPNTLHRKKIMGHVHLFHPPEQQEGTPSCASSTTASAKASRTALINTVRDELIQTNFGQEVSFAISCPPSAVSASHISARVSSRSAPLRIGRSAGTTFRKAESANPPRFSPSSRAAVVSTRQDSSFERVAESSRSARNATGVPPVASMRKDSSSERLADVWKSCRNASGVQRASTQPGSFGSARTGRSASPPSAAAPSNARPSPRIGSGTKSSLTQSSKAVFGSARRDTTAYRGYFPNMTLGHASPGPGKYAASHPDAFGAPTRRTPGGVMSREVGPRDPSCVLQTNSCFLRGIAAQPAIC